MQISAVASLLVGLLGIVAGLLNKRGGLVPESLDIVFYLIGLAGLIAAGALFYIANQEK